VRHTLDVVGGDTHEFEVSGETYADLLAEVSVNPHEVAVLVEGTPVPEDSPVEADRARVVRMIKGG
jgi:sulfur carrier protein